MSLVTLACLHVKSGTLVCPPPIASASVPPTAAGAYATHVLVAKGVLKRPVTSWLCDVVQVAWSQQGGQSFVGQQMGQPADCSDATNNMIDEEIKGIVDRAYRCVKLLRCKTATELA